MARPRLVLKLGGELLEEAAGFPTIAARVARLAARAALVVVHGGGREIDAALAAAGIRTERVDGLRVTDARTLEVVVGVLAGTINTRLVAAIRRAGAPAVGLTGADAAVATFRRAAPIVTVSGVTVDLGLVGQPVTDGRPRLLSDLLARGYVPVVACIGAARDGRLLNVNADTLAAHLAGAIGASRLVIAGGTAGVLDERGRTIPRLTVRQASALIRSGGADRGMVAKLQACRSALAHGVSDVVIVHGRDRRLDTLASRRAALAGCTQVVR